MKWLYINRTGDKKYILHNQEFEVLTVLLAGFNEKIKEYRSYSVASYHRENAFASCRILCWFTVWQGIAFLSPAHVLKEIGL